MKKNIILIAVISATLYFGYQWRLNWEFGDDNLAYKARLQNQVMGLPKLVGPMVTLNSISTQPGKKVFFIFTNEGAFASDVKPTNNTELIRILCHEPWEILAMQHGVTFTYLNYGKDGALATTLPITKADCGL